MPSTIPRFKAALLSRLQANPGLAGIQTSWGNPHPARLADELVIIGNATARQLPAGLGTSAQEERYTLEVIVSIAGSARTAQQALEERAFIVAGVIESSLLSWRTAVLPFGGTVIWASVENMSSGEALTTQGDTREASVTLSLAVVART